MTGNRRATATTIKRVPIHELPGLWFNTEELWGLLTCHALLGRLSQGLFGDPIAQLRQRVGGVNGYSLKL